MPATEGSGPCLINPSERGHLIKAIACTRYGSPDVLELVDRPKPVAADDEVLIRIRCATVSSADWRIRSLSLPAGFGLLARIAFGFRRPRQPVLGTELAGEVEAVGSKVTRFKPGDSVFAFAGARMGCHAEYRCIRADGPIAPKPTNLSWEQAASLSFGGATMLDFYRRAGLRSGERVLVNGASGTVGTAAVQLARHFGAHVTGVCSTDKLELVASIGADRVIDYTREDFARSGQSYDVVVDVAGTAPLARAAAVMSDGGRLLLVLADLAGMLRALGPSGGRKVIAGPASERAEYVHELGRLAAAGRFTPVVDRCYAFDEFRAAHRHVDGGRKRGSVVMRIGG